MSRPWRELRIEFTDRRTGGPSFLTLFPNLPCRNFRLNPNSIKADMNRLYVIIIAILCFTAVPVAIAGDIVKHYDEHHNITGYTVIDGDRQTHYDSSWNRTGYTTSEETKDTHYDIDQNRIGHTEWDNDDTGSHYDKEYNRTGYSKKSKDKETMFDNSWNRKGYKK